MRRSTSNTLWTVGAVALAAGAAYVIVTRLKPGDTVVVPVGRLTGVPGGFFSPSLEATVRVNSVQDDAATGTLINVSGAPAGSVPAALPVSFSKDAVVRKV